MDTPRATIDLKRLAAEVSVQHGIRVDPDDPMMAVVTLNRLVFEQALGQVLERVQASAKDFETAADKVQVRAGGALAQQIRDCGLELRQEVRKAFEDSRRSGLGIRRGVADACPTPRWFVIGTMLALVLFAVGVWVGKTLR